MRFFFSVLAFSWAVLAAASGTAQAAYNNSMAPLDITPKATMQATPYYGAGALPGGISPVAVMPLADSGAYRNTDNLYARTGSGEGMHDGGNLYGATGMAMPSAMPGAPNVTEQNFTFIPAGPSPMMQVSSGLPMTMQPQEPVYAAAEPTFANVQGYDNKPEGSYYGGKPRPEWKSTSRSGAWDSQTNASAMPAVKDNQVFSGLDATPQQHEPYYVVTANNADWTAMWLQHMGRQPPGRLAPGQVAVASFLGPRSYTGYEARVKIVGEDEQRIQVVATQATPAPQIAQTRMDNAPYAVLVVPAGSKGVEVIQNRALNTGNYNYADDPKAQAINWDPSVFYASPYAEKRVIQQASGNSGGAPYSGSTGQTAPSDPRAAGAWN